MEVIDSVSAMQIVCRRLARDGKSISLVPTMGALHDGHGSLIKCALGHNDGSGNCRRRRRDTANNHSTKPGDDDDDDHDDNSVLIVSIFANPIQFNDRKDLENYPRTLETDLRLCERLGVDFVFVPTCNDVYPPEPESAFSDKKSQREQHMVTAGGRCIVRPPTGIAQILEGKSRAGHFEGMLTVVCKLFNIIQPKRAYFGIKDYQQLVLVRKMVQDLNLNVEICAVETAREVETNLPLSSRNSRLDLDQRSLAGQVMFDTLVSAKMCLEEKCRRGNQLRSDCSNGDELNMVLLASLITSQLWIDLCDKDSLDLQRSHGDLATDKSSSVTIDYLELRCANDLSKIDYDNDLEVYDCQQGCVRRRLLNGSAEIVNVILDARILISILLSKVRLLDNIGLRINL